MTYNVDFQPVGRRGGVISGLCPALKRDTPASSIFPVPQVLPFDYSLP